MDALLPGLAGAPNVHPIFVHFPVALWPTALLLTVVVTILGADRGARLVFRHGIGTADEPVPDASRHHAHPVGETDHEH